MKVTATPVGASGHQHTMAYRTPISQPARPTYLTHQRKWNKHHGQQVDQGHRERGERVGVLAVEKEGCRWTKDEEKVEELGMKED